MFCISAQLTTCLALCVFACLQSLDAEPVQAEKDAFNDSVTLGLTGHAMIEALANMAQDAGVDKAEFVRMMTPDTPEHSQVRTHRASEGLARAVRS